MIILLSRMTEEMSKIPSTLSVIIYSFAVSLFFPELFEISPQEFDEILYLMLPVILLPDILNISIKELKNHAKEIFYLAVVAVVASITVATFITPYLLPQYSFTVGMLIALFTMLMATDAITVTSIMSKFKLPERLKIYAESESLFNDVTALIIFYFIALPLITGGEVSLLSINYILLKVLILSTVIGFGVAYIGFLSIKVLKNPFDQFVVIYLVVIISFLLAEYFHIAGILSIVASVLTFKYLVQKEIKGETQRRVKISSVKDKDSVLELIKSVPAITKREFREYKKEAMFIGIFANAIVFVIIANIIELQILLQYTKEILVVFAITTVIRFMGVSSLVLVMRLPFRWAKTLTLSGTKGALAIIMAHSIPESFIYKDMFEAIVVGNVLISTFFYTFVLMFHIKFNENGYAQDMQSDKQGSDDGILKYTKNVVDILEKDSYTQAYNRAFIEDIITNELARSSRYKLDLSLLILKLSNKEEKNIDALEVVGDVITEHIRTNDYFGKLSEDEYVIVASNTSLGGVVILAEKISEQFASEEAVYSNMDYYFGATQADETDSIEAVLEKLYEALSRTMQSATHAIEIEV
ncbi:cation:proton antiporter [Sulfurimonas sp.]|uniref:cation:proton antiporter domain-containing protein n=1 Tax=Sulfurimonas sp. TaxID=2022749 RepID=UPI0035636748